jgi:hypothetical protein
VNINAPVLTDSHSSVASFAEVTFEAQRLLGQVLGQLYDAQKLVEKMIELSIYESNAERLAGIIVDLEQLQQKILSDDWKPDVITPLSHMSSLSGEEIPVDKVSEVDHTDPVFNIPESVACCCVCGGQLQVCVYNIIRVEDKYMVHMFDIYCIQGEGISWEEFKRTKKVTLCSQGDWPTGEKEELIKKVYNNFLSHLDVSSYVID